MTDNGYMMIDTAKWPVADAGCSGWTCAMCGHAFTRAEALTVGRDMETCPGCTAEVLAYDLPTKLLAVERELGSSERVYARSWFHATLDSDWYGAVSDAAAPVHLGSYAAALMRSRDLRDLDGIGHPVNARWHVFEVTLDQTASVLPGVCGDADAWPETLEDMVVHADGHDIVRYLNRYEDPGSISLLVNAHAVKVIAHQIFHADEIDVEMRRVYL